ncbi:MAG: hypothetical protein CMJ49_02160 [Planctomycetaceae bacterium]|nr:hypothetical protein [Planctomycetaceae bacterium]
MQQRIAIILAGCAVGLCALPSAWGQVTAGDISFVTSYQNGTGGVTEMADVFAVAISPDGRHVYTAGGVHVAAFDRDAGDGSLTWIQGLTDGVGGIDGINNSDHPIALSPDGNYLYVPSINDDSIAIFNRDTATGLLSQVGMVTDQVGGVVGIDSPAAVQISADGQYLYASADGSVAVFDRDIATGQLNWNNSIFAPNLARLFNLNLSPDGQSAFAAARDGDFVTVFDRHAVSGQLTQIQILTGPYDGPIYAKATPDGQFVYVSSQIGDSISVFSRDPVTRQLAFIADYPDNVDGFNHFNHVWDEVFVPMTDLMLATAVHEDALTVMTRDDTTGLLTFEQVFRDGINGVTGMDGPRSIVISPDRKHIYVTAPHQSTLAVYALPGIGDVNKDGAVDIADLALVGGHWDGAGSTGFAGGVLVPVVGSWVGGVIAGVVLTARRQRRS